MHKRIHPRRQEAHRAFGLDELFCEVDFELCGLMPLWGDPGEDIAGRARTERLDEPLDIAGAVTGTAGAWPR